MRKPSKLELGLLVGVVLATGVGHAEETLPTVVVTGYYDDIFSWLLAFGEEYPPSPESGGGPGGEYSAQPTAHTNCLVTTFDNAYTQGEKGTIAPSQPNNTSLPIPVRYGNPIDISNGSSIGASYGGVNSASGFMIFPNLADGLWAALTSAKNYSNEGYTITDLVNAWAPPGNNPNALSNTLSGLGITATIASETSLSVLTASQLMQVVSAFSWQEGFKPSGC